jgi:small subunit ribosomal protein S8
MTMTDPIADMLTRLRNANSAFHEDVAMPSSKIKQGIAQILQDQGYVRSWRVEREEGAPGETLVIDLKFGPQRERSIAGIRRISKPGLREFWVVSESPSSRHPRGS